MKQQEPNTYSYNEVIVGHLDFTDRLPGSVEAFVFTQPNGEMRARKAHALFLKAYGLDAIKVPLLHYLGNEGFRHVDFSAQIDLEGH